MRLIGDWAKSGLPRYVAGYRAPALGKLLKVGARVDFARTRVGGYLFLCELRGVTVQHEVQVADLAASADPAALLLQELRAFLDGLPERFAPKEARTGAPWPDCLPPMFGEPCDLAFDGTGLPPIFPSLLALATSTEPSSP